MDRLIWKPFWRFPRGQARRVCDQFIPLLSLVYYCSSQHPVNHFQVILFRQSAYCVDSLMGLQKLLWGVSVTELCVSELAAQSWTVGVKYWCWMMRWREGLRTLTGGFWLTQWQGILPMDPVSICMNSNLKSNQDIFRKWDFQHLRYFSPDVCNDFVCINSVMQMKCGVSVSVTVILLTHFIALKSKDVCFFQQQPRGKSL